MNTKILNVKAEIKEPTKNDTPIALEIDYHNVQKLEANDEGNVIHEGFSLEANSFVIDPLHTVLNEFEGNIFFRFTNNGDSSFGGNIDSFFSRHYLLFIIVLFKM